MLEAKEANIITSDLYFTPSNVTDSTVTMTAVAGEGKTLSMTYTLGKDYMLHMSFSAQGMEGLFSPNYNKMDIDWSDKARQQERGFMFENRYTTLTYHNAEGGTDYLNEGSEKIDEKIEETIDWVSFKTSSSLPSSLLKTTSKGCLHDLYPTGEGFWLSEAVPG